MIWKTLLRREENINLLQRERRNINALRSL
jgi:hypothetical protein